MTNSNVTTFAEQLAEIYERMADAKLEADALIDAAKDSGMGPKDIAALRKVAKEILMQPDKLADKYAAEEQLDMFRAQVGIFKRKGLSEIDSAKTVTEASVAYLQESRRIRERSA